MKKIILTICLLLSLTSLYSFDFYWEEPLIIEDESFFPQTISGSDFIISIWQEYDGDGERDGSIRLYSSVSKDGINWSSKKTVTESIPYRWDQKAPIFSFNIDSNDIILVSVAESEKEISLYQSSDSGDSFEKTDSLTSQFTLVAPKLFLKKDSGFILFFQEIVTDFEGNPDSISMFSTESDNGFTWTVPENLNENDNLFLSFLPTYEVFNDVEYLVFQAIQGTENFQLYLKKRDAGSESWSGSTLLTDFFDFSNPDFDSGDFFNQRPHMAVSGDHLALVWERNLIGSNTQIYYATLDSTSDELKDMEAVTQSGRISAFPKIMARNGEEFLLWFDNRDGYRIILAQKRGFLWEDAVVSNMAGDSTYGNFVTFNTESGEEKILLFWENVFGNKNRTVILSPDQTVDKPGISPVNFIRNRRSSSEFPEFAWTEPVDSSFIRGFSYSWSLDEEEVPEEKLDLRDDPLRKRRSFQASEEGVWYLKVIAEDYAGNWSEPAVISFHYDITPPDEVVFIEPPTNPFGFALSNSFELRWEDPPDEDIDRYYYQVNYLGRDILDSSYARLTYATPTRVVPLNRSVSINNYDNGYWGITVVAEDTAGNRSKPSIQIFRLNKYIPVTYISNVTSVTDDLLRVKLTIRGRGFQTQGEIESVIIDRDGQEPWDLQYFLSEEDYAVIDDRTISGPLIDDIEGGVYRIAVQHPQRGIVFARSQLQFESTGVVKFGDFSTDYESIWELIPYEVRMIPGNLIMAIAVMVLLALIITVSAFRMVQIGREIRDLTYNSKALFEGGLMAEELRKEKLKTMKRKGLGLRIKFLMALLSLVISVILMLAITLGLYMINQQRENLGSGVEQRAELLLETLVSGAGNALQLTGLDKSLGLNALPQQTDAMDEAQYAIITGAGEIEQGVYNYIWANNDENINRKYPLPASISISESEQLTALDDDDPDVLLRKLYKEEENQFILSEEFENQEAITLQSYLYDAGIVDEYIRGGVKQISDIVTAELTGIEEKINEQGREIVGDIPAQIEELQRKGGQLLLAGASEEEINNVQVDLRALSEQLNERLSNIADQSFIYPDFIPAELNRDQLEYIFYRPVVFEDSNADSYYRGAVRLGITVEPILDQIDESITGLIQITILISLAALAMGIIGALILASTMINPIRKLVAGVERIRDAEDITKLKGQDIKVRSRDELADLAQSVNQMTSGLIKAAIANEQLMLGQEVQKKFVRLDPVPSGEERKLPSGYTDTDNAEFYGYYVGAKGVSGDYFNYRQIDKDHYACIKCDISGKDIPASLIMVVVATVFDSYCKNLNLKKDGIHLNKMVEDVNDLIEQLNFKGKFAAFTIVLINIRTGKTWMSNAGDNIVHYFDASKREMDSLELFKAPAAGPFSTDLIDMQGGFKQETHTFQSGDIVFLFTDGIEESQRTFRNRDLEIIKCEGCEFAGEEGATENRDTDTHLIGSDVEELGLKRIDEIANAILNGETYELIKHHNPFPEQKLTFNFDGCYDSIEDGVMGLLSVEKIFRLYPDPAAGPNDRIMVYRKIDDFLRKHFDQYDEYFKHPVDHPDMPEYIYYTHLKENAQYDDLTVLAIRRK